MSPILDLQPSLPTAFRLRMGERKGNRPADLDGRIRVTSAIRPLIEDIAREYQGGDITEWQSPEGLQWQTILPARPLAVILMPGQAISQWWEKWDGGGCARRCDGHWEQINGTECVCPAPTERGKDRARWCQPHTRVTILLPKLTQLAAGRLDSTGIIAAREMAGTIEVAQAALDRGVMVRARLTIRKRATGKRQYVWPELVIGGPAEGFALGRGEAPALPAADPETGELTGGA